jgi:hypothetical protein
MDKRTLFLGASDAGVFAQALDASMEKTAGVPGQAWDTADEIRRFIKTLTKKDRAENCYVLVTALGAGEYYGSNINADYFPWDALAHEGEDYGYKTFLNAHAYAHHVNKDSERSFGIPVVSVLNPRMKRVELVIKLNRAKAKQEGADGIISRIDAGEFPDVSMGCKVPFDVCSYCGHHSKTRDDYCEHMRPPPEMRGIWGPNRITSDGVRICVYNTLPRFFDISFVFIGADKIAKVMAKLASKGNQHCLGSVCALPSAGEEDAPVLYGAHGEVLDVKQMRKVASAQCDGMRGPCGRLCDDCAEKRSCHSTKLASAFGVKEATERKVAEMLKTVPAGNFAMKKLPEMEASEPDLPNDILDSMAGHPLQSSMGTSSLAGVVLKPREFQRIVLIRMGEDDLANDLDRSRHVFRPVHRFDDSLDLSLDPVEEILHLLLPYLRARSALGAHLHLRRSGPAQEVKKTLPTHEPVAHPLLDKVSAAYNGYRRSMMLKLSKVREEVESDSRLRAAILGETLGDMFLKTSRASSVVTPDSVAYMMSAHLSDRSLLSGTAVAESIAVSNTSLLSEGLTA